MHYYTKKNGAVKLLADVTTPSQARKHGSAYPSVTTLLGYLPNEYINSVWKPKMFVQYAREFPDLEVDEIKAKMWGERTCPETLDTISSSEFGTKAHARLEDHMNAQIDGFDLVRDHPYDGIISPTLSFLALNGFTPVSAERMIACDELKTAGMLDLIAEHEGRLVLMDYKFRDCADGKGKTYDKDCAQLAIEAKMVMEQDELDYMPECYTICIDSTAGTPYVKKWTHAAVKKGIQTFIAARNLYYDLPGLGYEL